MGCITSKPDYFESSDGDGSAYTARWEEGVVLGEGEFGQVKIVTDKSGKISTPCAMKELKKGFVWKDNTLYEPMNPETLRTEVECLRKLRGEQFNMKLEALYESSSAIYIISELCKGGEMLDYLSQGTRTEGLRTEDISRISYQLLSAVAHCNKLGIMHRDLKPENTMFTTDEKDAELRLIDFGCASFKDKSATFIGTPFYLAPEVYQKSYGKPADVFSVGVTLLVLVAGYPADALQKAFNIVQKKSKNLRTFPGMPTDLPETFFEMVDGLLAYKPDDRMTASKALTCEFVRFHKELEGGARPGARRTQSILFSQTGQRHGAYMGFKKFERAVTTILATIPTREELQKLLKKLTKVTTGADPYGSSKPADQLKVIKMEDLKEMLMDMGLIEASSAIEKLPGATNYDGFSYHVENLKEFSRKTKGNAAASGSKTKEADLGGTANGNGAATNGGTGTTGPRRQRFSLIVQKPEGGIPKREMNKNAMSLRF